MVDEEVRDAQRRLKDRLSQREQGEARSGERDARGQLRTPEALEEVRGALTAGTGFLQAFVPGDEEYAVHLLRQNGQTLFRRAIHYRMAGPGLVKGTAAAPVTRTWLTQVPFAPLWDRIAGAIGLTDGTACFDFRLTPESPILFEINPRIGGSLTQRARPYLKAYLRAVGAGACLPAAD